MRILTRGDLDGLTSSLLLTLVEDIREIRFGHPKDVQDGMVEVDETDIVVNLPYVPGCAKWFDHHVSEDAKLKDIGEFGGRFEVAPSCARVIANHYKSPKFEKYESLLEATDRLDAAQLSIDDVLNPQGWILLGFTLDPRSGLGPEFQKYFRWLMEYIKEVPMEKVLEHHEVKKRVKRIKEEDEAFRQFLKEHSKQDGSVIITDFRGLKHIPVGNRFLVYTLYPEANVEVRLISGINNRTVLAIGKSIFNRTNEVNIGELCGAYGGGGHKGAGTCQLLSDRASVFLEEIIETLKGAR